ncbi:exosome complex component RRP42 isoform X2 [Centroberyx affinis]|uniref:exosome complex component RRP42 isoform X2 n=1 Tax=Centroberyx affinis TaxID=166261 RepID=UPI003A5BBDB1
MRDTHATTTSVFTLWQRYKLARLRKCTSYTVYGMTCGWMEEAVRTTDTWRSRLTWFPTQTAQPKSHCSANATPEFEGRGGEELGTELSNTLYKVFNNKRSVDLKSLCISAGEHCWALYVDVLLLQCDGNLYDAISVAIKAALFNTKIPKVFISADDEGGKEIELSDDPYDCMRLDVENVPCIVTLCKVGHRHVVDATLQEKACSVASLIISVTHKGTVTCVRKVGGGSLDPESIFEMTEAGKRVGKALHAPLMKLLHQEESLGKKRQKVGFLG